VEPAVLSYENVSAHASLYDSNLDASPQASLLINLSASLRGRVFLTKLPKSSIVLITATWFPAENNFKEKFVMQNAATAADQSTFQDRKGIHLANLKPSDRKAFFKQLKDDCCPELKDNDVQRAMEQSLGIESFSSEDYGDGFVAFRAVLPTGEHLITSRLQLQQCI
jgi:hypothetical protein